MLVRSLLWCSMQFHDRIALSLQHRSSKTLCVECKYNVEKEDLHMCGLIEAQKQLV